jgi:LmbE family N-acetylglucosaminyl deacetylase
VELLRALASRHPYAGRAALVCAHPDDESIAAGGSLSLLPDLVVVHVTDGAPRRLDDWRRLGFAAPEAYASARAAELRAALAAAGCDAPHAMLGYPDQDAALHLADAARRLAVLFAEHRVEAVLTHAYEGGHPDHDATAWACHAAARLAAARPTVAEFPLYHAGLGEHVKGEFLPSPGPEPVVVHLTDAEQARKRAMYAAHASQAEVLAGFGAERETFRAAPRYDWRRPPHPGPLLYEHWGWEMTGERWRALAAAAEATLWP